jgi:hypothetical protein
MFLHHEHTLATCVGNQTRGLSSPAYLFERFEEVLQTEVKKQAPQDKATNNHKRQDKTTTRKDEATPRQDKTTTRQDKIRQPQDKTR